ncbi:alpha-glucosidase MalA [Stygiolobus caldivivus]|uniref:Alpha-glucosidase n=1 Tax=Stygiolobus caldivivus TaxID=2824673 RepID=A0A8D5U6X4_9CREN|nr:alpha-glucosidase MalA [Stygiolobus caldivivus]BCU69951.1 alpha-glucosidase [Stygiolobus caldivivus]
MRIEVEEKEGIYKVTINEPFPPLDLQFNGNKSQKSLADLGLDVTTEGGYLVIEKELHLKEHVLGLGEKAVELDRRRRRYVMNNTDPGIYQKFHDPLYINIPFMISVVEGKATGYFVNSASLLVFDIGFEDYGKVRVKVPEEGVELYILEGPTIEKVLERYSLLVGKPFLPPKWAFGYMISRYSYYPQDKIVELIDLLKGDGFPVEAVFLDIDFMDSFKLFTWHKKRFYDPAKFLNDVHSRGVKVVTIVDHSVRADQNYEVFASGLGKYCELDTGELFVGRLWPGNCVYPDFFRQDTREWWSKLIADWLSQGVDGIWLDMNEPTDFSRIDAINQVFRGTPIQVKDLREYGRFPENVVHYFKGKKVPHNRVRNAYPYYQAMATFDGFKSAGKGEVFILSRSGFAGIQKYAFVWTGDSTSSWDQLRLQIQMVLGLSISGVPYVGIDIGGFQGRNQKEIDNSPEMLMRQFQIAMFFPFFRTHKAPDGVDTEPIYLPSYYKEKVKKVIETRYRFLPYMYCLAEEAHETGHPIVRPLFYEFQEDEDTYRVDDEYMLGSWVLYAPVIYPQMEVRKSYLPVKAKWADFWTGEVLQGWVDSRNDLPVYIREGSVIPLSEGDFIVYGEGSITVEGVSVRSSGKKVTFSKPYRLGKLLVYGLGPERARADGKEVEVVREGKVTVVRVDGTVKEVEME